MRFIRKGHSSMLIQGPRWACTQKPRNYQHCSYFCCTTAHIQVPMLLFTMFHKAVLLRNCFSMYLSRLNFLFRHEFLWISSLECLAEFYTHVECFRILLLIDVDLWGPSLGIMISNERHCPTAPPPVGRGFSYSLSFFWCLLTLEHLMKIRGGAGFLSDYPCAMPHFTALY